MDETEYLMSIPATRDQILHGLANLKAGKHTHVFTTHVFTIEELEALGSLERSGRRLCSGGSGGEPTG